MGGLCFCAVRVMGNVVELLASGDDFAEVERIGTNEQEARRQAYAILEHWQYTMVPVLVALITEIQKQDKQIEMLEYQTKWRKRRP